MWNLVLLGLRAVCGLARTGEQRDYDVVLYGAYGCVGHFAARHLANQSGLRWAIAGRNASKLHALAAALAPLPSGKPDVLVASLTGDLSWVRRARAVATAAGHYMATGRIPCVYMQNSGLGNVVNPMTSMLDRGVFSIPMLLLVGWRGEPGKKDEPHHKIQGNITAQLLK